MHTSSLHAWGQCLTAVQSNIAARILQYQQWQGNNTTACRAYQMQAHTPQTVSLAMLCTVCLLYGEARTQAQYSSSKTAQRAEQIR